MVEAPGDETVLHIGEVPAPALGPGGLRLRVAATDPEGYEPCLDRGNVHALKIEARDGEH